MRTTLRLHDEVMKELEIKDSIFNLKVHYPQYGDGGFTVIIDRTRLPKNTLASAYQKWLDSYLEKCKDSIKSYHGMRIIGNSKYVF